MPRTLRSRLVPGAAVAATLVLTAGALAAPADAATTKKKFDIDRIGYNEFMRAGALETYADIPRNLPQNMGFTRLSLIKDIGEESPRCWADGAGYWLSEEVEEGVIKGGAAPIAEGQTQSDASPYDNPTLSRTLRPAGSSDGGDKRRRSPSRVRRFGPAGLQILSPSVYPDQDTGRMTITAPAGNLGMASRAGTTGQNFGARFASITWVGDNISADSA